MSTIQRVCVIGGLVVLVAIAWSWTNAVTNPPDVTGLIPGGQFRREMNPYELAQWLHRTNFIHALWAAITMIASAALAIAFRGRSQ